MQRNYFTEHSTLSNHQELGKQTAFHEAGHAAAIYFRNRQKQLPPVYFKIQIKKPDNSDPYFSAKVVDGLLLQNLPPVILENLAELSYGEQHSYQRAYEADVVNLLVGPIAEAKYISIRDDEILTQNLLTIQAMHHYGGYSDIEKAYSHLSSFIADHSQREEKMLELFQEAYRFIDDPKNWKCILNLARYILECGQNTISSEEICMVLSRCAA